MTYFYVDDGLHANPKARSVPLAAMGLWALSGSFCGDQLTEGIIPDWFIRSMTGGRTAAKQLVDVRLWHAPGQTCDSKDCPANRGPVPSGHHAFHDWYKINRKTKIIVEAERAASAERVKQHRERKRNGVTNAPQSNPIQSIEEQEIHTSPSVLETGDDRPTELSTSGDEPVSDFQARIDFVIQLVRTECGRTIDVIGAGRVIEFIWKRRGDKVEAIRNVPAYFARTVHAQWAEFQQFVDDEGLAL